MAHWSDGYIGLPHLQWDCAELVEKVLREQLGRVVHFPRKEGSGLFHRAALVTAHVADFARPINTPHDGCGVLMLARGRMAHMGLYCDMDQPHLLHSDSRFGSSTRIPMTRVQPPRYLVEGFYAWLD